MNNGEREDWLLITMIKFQTDLKLPYSLEEF